MVLEVDNIELNYGTKKVLSGIYLHSKLGTVTGIMGRNGSGKTSLLNIIFGSLSSKYKSIRIDGKNIKKPLFSTNKIAYLPQHRLLTKKIKLKTAFKLFNIEWDEFIGYFESFKIYKEYRAHQISSGELRLIETYLILKSHHDVILLDEPFSFIAPVYVERIKALIHEQKSNKIILITDHSYEHILDISDNIYLLKNGCSKLIGNTKELINEGYLTVNSLQKWSPR
ncbi:ATP-binding cassette domain-containing protein [Flagellimonas pelagia]|uniref:ATP-binding cassette domain-containing protein n=1 Tax=Flagellimonas pelagia TaxID=2306998 RepID=A0A3A1NII2_9FLAO|nr:ATP-binding cassette domain-containing protein [Allomuricauda maritima]RIV45417.1 ATP-binding cassette domain-containing protein [Allomuricauda maritima]TXJ96894.1 ATP-binding cassette domain-containing protein [Allomuricauda maritima]